MVENPKQGQIEIDVETVYGLYEVKVKAVNNIGESYQPAFVILGRSGEDGKFMFSFRKLRVLCILKYK